jgi:hypothetical protein
MSVLQALEIDEYDVPGIHPLLDEPLLNQEHHRRFPAPTDPRDDFYERLSDERLYFLVAERSIEHHFTPYSGLYP